MPVLLLIAAGLLNSAAHILLKTGVRAGLYWQTFNPVVLVRDNIFTVAGLGIFVISTGFYLAALRSVPVSIAYPVVIVSSFIVINFFAVLYLKENISVLQLVGYGCLLVGLVLIYYYR